MKRVVVAASTGIVLVLACGGRTLDSEGGDGGDSGAIGIDASADSGWTPCSSPDGYMVCGGPNDCNAGTECAKDCLTAELEPCGNYRTTWNYDQCDDPPCPDGSLCLPLDGVQVATPGPISGLCVTDQIGQLFHLNGADDRLIHMDYSIYGGTPLPSPTTCPSTPGLTLCGGACGDTCGDGGTGVGSSVCFGRSPKHPYSICAVYGPSCTRSDQSACKQYGNQWGTPQGCLIFDDDAASQPNADAHGLCIPQDTCQAAASEYPGGGVSCLVP